MPPEGSKIVPRSSPVKLIPMPLFIQGRTFIPYSIFTLVHPQCPKYITNSSAKHKENPLRKNKTKQKKHSKYARHPMYKFKPAYHEVPRKKLKSSN